MVKNPKKNISFYNSILSAAYQETAAKSGSIDAQISLIEVKRDNVKGQLLVYNEEKSSINEAVSSLRNGLSTNRIQYKDTLGNIITTQSSSTRRALEKQLDQAIERQTIINSKVDILNEDLFKYETEIVEVSTNNDVAGELGPLKYLSGLTGIPMDKIINYLLLTIIFVFDPLAIALVVAANYAFEQIRPKTKENLYGEKVEIKEEPKIEPLFEEDEKRMNIIGQNGNDGIHYGKEAETEIEEELIPPKTYTQPGYVKNNLIEEKQEIEKIIKRPLMAHEIKQLQQSKLNIFNDDLTITY